MRPVLRNLLAALLLMTAAASRADVPADSLRARAGAAPGIPVRRDSVARRDSVEHRDAVTRRGPLAPRDSAARRDTAGASDTLALRPTHSPSLAMLLSAVAPGAGQLYNRSYWKVPVVVGLGLYFASTWLDQNRRTQIYRQKYAASLLPGAPDYADSALYLSEREFYKEQRDTFAWYFFILYVVNIADAYVDASLYDFDVGPDLKLRVLPVGSGPAGPSPGVTLTLHF
ncbi:MAG TPA: DUF5683 domain-containing protein [Bacteroidota bacterium]|nr:DUF5683 domain-containing protein [Bacteroidota bacterium]